MKPNLPAQTFEEAQKVYDQAYDEVYAEMEDSEEAQDCAEDMYDKYIHEQYEKMADRYRTITSVHLGKAIKRARKEKGLTQLDIATMLGCMQSSVSRYERGELSLTFVDMVKLSLELWDCLDHAVEEIVLEDTVIHKSVGNRKRTRLCNGEAIDGISDSNRWDVVTCEACRERFLEVGAAFDREK